MGPSSMGLTITHGQLVELHPYLHMWWRHLWHLRRTITKLQDTTTRQLLLLCTITSQPLRLRTITSMLRWLSTLALQLLLLNTIARRLQRLSTIARLPPRLSTSPLFSTLVHLQGLRFDSITPTLEHKLPSNPSTKHGNIIVIIVIFIIIVLLLN
jgi:hypothetical protein